MNRVLLTIAIPTFNRAQFLESTLYRLADQAGEKNGGVEIVILDNASTDDTGIIARRFTETFPFIRYFRNETNLGLDGNIYQCFRHADGSYVWFFSDDDIPLPNSLEVVIAEIEKSKPTVLVMGSRQLNETKIKDELHGNKNFYAWDESGAAREFLAVIMLPRLIVKKVEIDLDRLVHLPSTVFPQVTLCIEMLKHRFLFATRNDVIVERNPGFVSSNFFQLYCLGVRSAIRHALCDDANKYLMPETEKALQEFVFLEVMERAGVYLSREGLPINTWRAGWQDLGNSFGNKMRLILILVISRMPRVLSKLVYFLALLKSDRNPRKAVLRYVTSVRNVDTRTADV